MRKVLITGILLLFAYCLYAQLQKPSAGYVIDGKLTGSYRGKVYLAREDGIGGVHTSIDSCEVVDGTYRFEGERVDMPTMHYIRDRTGQWTPFFLENGHIRIKGKADDFYNAEVRGTLNNEILRYYTLLTRYIQDSISACTAIDGLREGESDAATRAARYKQRGELYRERCLAIEKELVLRYPEQPFAPLMLVHDIAYRIPLAELKDFRSRLSPELEGHPYVRALDEFIGIQDFNVGSRMPDFCIPGIQGKEICLKDYRGKYVLLDFWASWCGPCRREMPNVVNLYKSSKGMKFEIIGISLDSQEKPWKKAVEEMKMTWPQGCDLRGWNSEVARKCNIHAIPATVLLDPEGKVVALNLWGEALTAKVKEVLGKKK